ncbi:dihydropyrimidine dehydrogenase [candidate division LCP-89 bacterium B3_LCP]|uniref:dihydrouracil dehydrogenase (NAD(+)) n=1 Tax=candidate division LCP-89 bacterium B3_LCP TaxID=2012998 RepID=A0A532URQ7_UNCL8|nr:MAG: dihydropyrimidine dehydrogenase [candidate division LCP-89 bacterium B3_LCP]
MNKSRFLTDAQLEAEIRKCEYCEEKPCKQACPVDCSPADFIMAVKGGRKSDYKRAAALILSSNPLGGVCGVVCPDRFCVFACVHRTFDHPVNIPAVQATIIRNAAELNVLPRFSDAKPNGLKIAVVGSGPAGLGAAAILAQLGCRVEIFEKGKNTGGMCRLIPDFRLPRKVLNTDVAFTERLGEIKFHFKTLIDDPISLLNSGFQAVIIASGLDTSLSVGFPGEEHAYSWLEVLKRLKNIPFKEKRVGIIGGGAIAVDCAVTARRRGAQSITLICLEKPHEMPLTAEERNVLLNSKVELMGRTRISSLRHGSGIVEGVLLQRVQLPQRQKFHPAKMVIDPEIKPYFVPFDLVVVAIGAASNAPKLRRKGLFYTGDCINGPTSVVEAVAAGKNTAAEVHAYLQKEPKPVITDKAKSTYILAGAISQPVPLNTDFFDRKILSPFLLSAAPTTDGYEQMKKAYDAGWAGGIMKTAFDSVPVHIPSEYMFAFGSSTYGNCDNVSEHPLDRVCREAEKLVREFPERLTLVSTGGQVTGHDEADKKVWQSNTEKLKNAGVMGIEYSLSCPQGGDGTKGDIVSQDPELTAKIVDWILAASDPETPKLFKLTSAVTAIHPVVEAIQAVFQRYPCHQAGITLANSFPGLAFRDSLQHPWEEGVVIGLSGAGIVPISNLTLAKVASFGMVISGNGGPMDYKAAADFLALGAQTVQFCSIVLKYGYGIIDELHSGLSYLLEEKGLNSVDDLIGISLPHPITDFNDLPLAKKISSVTPELCQHCGNCQRCPYLAISLDENNIPLTDPVRCIGCSLCVLNCFSRALYMRDRTAEELEILSET